MHLEEKSWSSSLQLNSNIAIEIRYTDVTDRSRQKESLADSVATGVSSIENS